MRDILNITGPDEPNEDKNRGKKQNDSNSRDEDFEHNYGDLEGGDTGKELPETDQDDEFLE